MPEEMTDRQIAKMLFMLVITHSTAQTCLANAAANEADHATFCDSFSTTVGKMADACVEQLFK